MLKLELQEAGEGTFLLTIYRNGCSETFVIGRVNTMHSLSVKHLRLAIEEQNGSKPCDVTGCDTGEKPRDIKCETEDSQRLSKLEYRVGRLETDVNNVPGPAVSEKADSAHVFGNEEYKRMCAEANNTIIRMHDAAMGRGVQPVHQGASPCP